MLKKIVIGAVMFVFVILAAGIVAQSSVTSADLLATRTPVVGESIPTRTPVVGQTVPTRTPVPNAPKLQISNFIDFAPGLTEIIIKLNGEERVILKYGDSSEYMFVPVGTYLMEVVGVTGDTRGPEDYLLAYSNVTFALEQEYSAIIGGDAGANQPGQIQVVQDDNSEPPAGKAKIRIAHFAPFDSVLANTEVDVIDEGTSSVLAGLADVPFGTISGYIEVDAGTAYDLIVTNDAGTVLDLPPIAFSEGEIVTIVVNGGGANQPVDAGVVSNLRKLFLPVVFE